MGVSVTKRISQITQPRGGYINPKDMVIIPLQNQKELKEEENIPASLIGLVVDYLTRFMLTYDIESSFKVPFLGAKIINELEIAKDLAKYIMDDLDKWSIISACQLVGYDVCYRAGVAGYRPVEEIEPDDDTIYNIRELVKRSLRFFDTYGPIVKDGFTLEGGYTSTISSGDGDFLTNDTLWDFKVSKSAPTNKQTLQLLVYYLMGKHSIHKEFDSIKYLAIFNPRLNTIYRYDLNNLTADIIEKVEKEVIGY